jgi:hypothetical protein
MNKKFSLIPALAIVSVIVLSYSCTKEENIRKKLDLLAGNGYYPVEIGNYWKFSGLPLERIDSGKMVNGKEYFRFTRETGNYYRSLSEGNVYLLHKDGTTEEVLFDLNAEIGESWFHSLDELTGFAERRLLNSQNNGGVTGCPA